MASNLDKDQCLKPESEAQGSSPAPELESSPELKRAEAGPSLPPETGSPSAKPSGESFFKGIFRLCSANRRAAAISGLWCLAILGAACLMALKYKLELDKAMAQSADLKSSLEKMKEEQGPMREAALKVAPEFLGRAQRYVSSMDPEKADDALKCVLALSPDSPQANLYYGRLLLGRLELDKAAAAFAKAQSADSKGAYSALSDSFKTLAPDGKLDDASVFKLACELDGMGDWFALTALAAASGKPSEELAQKLQGLEQEFKAANPNLKKLSFICFSNPAGTLLSLFKNSEVSDISPLKGMPLAALNLDGTKVESLAPLEGMQLKSLSLAGTKAADLSPLKGMPLESLNLERTKVENLGALEGMPLSSLNLGGTPVSDISTLKGMPLASLNLSSTKVAKLEALEGMKLERLNLDRTKAASVKELAGMPLKKLSMAWTGKLADLSPLKGAPLEELLISGASVTDLSPLSGMPLKRLDIGGLSKVKDISPLKGMPLKQLSMSGVQAPDLSALKGMSLAELDAKGGPFDSVAPLAGMPLEVLMLSKTRVYDVSPLAGMPLRELFLDNCPALQSMKPVADCCKELVKLTLPSGKLACDELKSLPKLKYIDTEPNCRRTAAQFWADLESGKIQR